MATKQRVMVIDDDPAIAELLELFLADTFEVLMCSDPEEALNRLFVDPFDVILADLKMPKMRGKDLIIQIRSRGFKMPIVVITGYSEKDPEVSEALSVGGTDVLTKPFRNPDEITSKLRKLINQ